MLSEHVDTRKGQDFLWVSPLITKSRMKRWREWLKQQGSLPEDIPEACRYLLRWILEYRLSQLPTRLIVVPVEESIRFHVAAYGIHSCVWVQFAMAVDYAKGYGYCRLCSRPFELTPDVNRSDRQFCSDNCRVKAYQRRKAKSRQLRQEGKTLREIAAALETDIKTVKGWVEPNR